MTEPTAQGGSRPLQDVRAVFVSALAAVLLLQSAWMLVLPMFRGPDEIEHLLRASNVALGHWQPAPGAHEDLLVRADATLAADAERTCLVLREDFDPSVCRPAESHPDGTVDVRSTAALYNPAYYAVVGLPLRVTTGETGAWLVRVVGALLGSAMLAWAWALMTSGRRTGWPSVALLAALTPAITFATTVAAPNGLGFAAGVLLWSGLLSALRTPGTTTVAACACAVGGTTLVLTHTTGVVWLATAVLTALVLGGRRGVHEILVRAPRAWAAATALVVLAVLASVAWTLQHAATAPRSGEPLVAETKAIPLPAHAVLWVFQTIGVMPNRFGLMWPVVYAVGLVPVVMVLVLGVRAGARRDRLAMGVAATVAVLVPVAATAATYSLVGVAWQGRYELPLLVGILMVAGEALDRSGRPVRPPLLVVVAAAAVTTHVLCLLCLGLREAGGPYDDGRPWGLLLGVVVPVLALSAYAVLLLARRVGTTEQDRPDLVEAEREG